MSPPLPAEDLFPFNAHEGAKSSSATCYRVETPDGRRTVWVADSLMAGGAAKFTRDFTAVVDRTKGVLEIPRWLAVKEGLVEDEQKDRTGGTGVGIPLKRQRLPDPPDLLDAEYIEQVAKLCPDPLLWEATANGAIMYYLSLVALVANPDSELGEFVAMAPEMMTDLLIENDKLRGWIKRATERANRKGTRR